MAAGQTGRAGFANVTGGATTTPIPEFPKLPPFLKRMARTDADRRELEEYEFEVQEFFKKQIVRQGL
jgi:hypothetical protein